MDEPEDGAVASKMEDIAMKLLDIAGKMYSRGADDVNEAKT